MSDAFSRITAAIDALLGEKERILVAIDGNCGAGKTTLAARLANHYGCCVFPMDEFFLRPEQRSEARLAEAGGNIDYERFRSEVLLPLQNGISFTYRPFDCGSLTLGNPVSVIPGRLSIVEGSYSQHPHFASPYDLTVFLTVSPTLQRERILQRPAFLHERFFTEWIPMENRYFEAFQIADKASLVLCAEDLLEEHE